MNGPLPRGWRFLLPELEAPEQAAGLQLTPTGGPAMLEGDAAVRQAVLLLLSTRPGERVMRPTYGCGLHRLVFSPNDDTTAGLAIHAVRQALERWEPRVEVIRLDAMPSPTNPGRLEVSLEYQVRRTLHSGHLAFPVQLTGETV